MYRNINGKKAIIAPYFLRTLVSIKLQLLCMRDFQGTF